MVMNLILIRSIPAWAGEPYSERAKKPESWVYPRVGGGTPTKAIRAQCCQGLSPRGRGNHA